MVLVKPIQQPYLDWIRCGKKTFEGRLKSKVEEWNVHVGDKIIFYNPVDPDVRVHVRVTSLLLFTDFGNAFDVLGEKLIPETSREGVVELYNCIYSEILIQSIGVVAIGIEVMSYTDN